ncbi:MAG: substrate-binding periplasmic protein [Desulfovibrio aminophilus]|uniref:substrate-binding periplasmic protein n=1 Tax=Desulfovibrio aminophilus TaxID=81425 RepID=UPI0039E98B0D
MNRARKSPTNVIFFAGARSMRGRFQYHALMTGRPAIFLWALLAAMLLSTAEALPFGNSSTAKQNLVFVTEQMKPFSYKEDGKIRGIAADIVTEALNSAGIAHTLELLPWNRAVERSQTEPGVFIFCLARTPEREHRFAWVAPLAPAELVLFRLRSRGELAEVGRGNLAGYRVAAIRGYFTAEILRQWGVPEANVTLFPDQNKQAVIEHLELGRSDFFLGDVLVFGTLLKDAGKEDAVVQNSPSQRAGDYYLAAHPGTPPEVLRRVGEAVRSLQSDGRAQTIFQEYMRRTKP